SHTPPRPPLLPYTTLFRSASAFPACHRPLAERTETRRLLPRTYATYGVPLPSSASTPSCTPRTTISAEAGPLTTKRSEKASAACPSLLLAITCPSADDDRGRQLRGYAGTGATPSREAGRPGLPRVIATSSSRRCCGRRCSPGPPARPTSRPARGRGASGDES